MMYTALYYPSFQISNRNLMKSALLLWDQLEFIVPFKEARPYSSDDEVREALELIGVGRPPTRDEKKLAHSGVLELANAEPFHKFLVSKIHPSNLREVYPNKFLPKTWDALKDSGLSELRRGEEFGSWVMERSISLAMMSILAEVCAGSEVRTVTDRVAAYRSSTHSISGLHGGSVGLPADDVERLVTISLKIVNPAKFSMKRLIEFRKREEKAGGVAIRQLRHGYLDKIDKFVKRLGSTGGHQASRKEIERQFEQEMKDDLDNLKEALQLKAGQSFLSKEVLVGILAGIGIAAPAVTVPSAVIGIGALVRRATTYRAERKAVLGDHAMSWLFEMSRGPIKPY